VTGKRCENGCLLSPCDPDAQSRVRATPPSERTGSLESKFSRASASESSEKQCSSRVRCKRGTASPRTPKQWHIQNLCGAQSSRATPPRQQQIKAVWRQLHATKGAESNAARTTVPAEVAAWLETTQTDLEQELRAHPVSGSASGSPRQKALARREMLFDVRDMRQYLASPSPLLATHIEKSLEAALNALSATKPERRAVSPATPAGDRGASSAGLKAMLVVNALLLILVVVWWLWRRSR